MHKWPKSLHCQVEAAFQSIRGFCLKKIEAPDQIRSIRTWKAYRYEAHRFADYLISRGCATLLDPERLQSEMSGYLDEVVLRFRRKGNSLQSLEAMLAALGKLEHAINNYNQVHELGVQQLDTSQLRRECHARAKSVLKRFSSPYDDRAYPDPESLIDAIADPTHRLQALLQLEGGLRAEGVGAPRGELRNPLISKALKGVRPDPVNGEERGVIVVKEKGGKVTEHFVSLGAYRQLEEHLTLYGELSSDYGSYLKSIVTAARATHQHATGRGTHGLKFSFAQRRYHECLRYGFTHGQALLQVSLETAHFRLKETYTYTIGR